MLPLLSIEKLIKANREVTEEENFTTAKRSCSSASKSESETTTIFTSVTTKGKAQGTLLFEGGMLKTGPKVVQERRMPIQRFSLQCYLTGSLQVKRLQKLYKAQR